MLSTHIKEATKKAHQELEAKVVRKLKEIRSQNDYAGLLKYFYAYFSALEKAMKPYVTAEVLPDFAKRRNAVYLKNDIEELGNDVTELPAVTLPEISNVVQGLGAMYVMEGSIMGGPHIVQMLQKAGIDKGVSFFSGYGAETGVMWGSFTEILNHTAKDEKEQAQAIATANDTFLHFSNAFG